MALVSQYEGAGNVINQTSAAEKALDLLHYKGHEARFGFNDYFAQARKYFRTLALDPSYAMTAGDNASTETRIRILTVGDGDLSLSFLGLQKDDSILL